MIVSIRPPPFGRGKPQRQATAGLSTVVSIRPPPFGRGKRFDSILPRPPVLFQSAPRLSEGGNGKFRVRVSLAACFNPPPAFRKGETRQVVRKLLRLDVSIRPPPFGRGKRVGFQIENVVDRFQSAPRLSEGGNVSQGKRMHP